MERRPCRQSSRPGQFRDKGPEFHRSSARDCLVDADDQVEVVAKPLN